ncbi:hypothetical protein GCM10027591_18290 [Zhihengliuella somnathii]
MPYAVQAAAPGAPDVLSRVEIVAPAPGPGQIVIDVAATGVNFIETYQRSGVYPVDFPFTPGTEAAGTVSAVGERVQVRLQGAELLPGVGVRGDRADLHLGMAGEQAQDFSARVPAGPGNGHCNRHGDSIVTTMHDC